QDSLAARIAHDVVDGEEIMRVFQFSDQIELLAQDRAQAVLDSIGKMRGRARPGQIFQMLLRGFSRRDRLPPGFGFFFVFAKMRWARQRPRFRQSPRENRKTAAPFPRKVSDSVPHWLEASCRLPRSSFSPECR